jgi:alcohol dehydrogenase class IV
LSEKNYHPSRVCKACGSEKHLPGCTVASRGHSVNFPHQLGVDFHVKHGFHQSQMLNVIMCLEQRVACEKFNEDATYTPNVAGEGPSKPEDDFRGSVMAR